MGNAPLRSGRCADPLAEAYFGTKAMGRCWAGRLPTKSYLPNPQVFMQPGRPESILQAELAPAGRSVQMGLAGTEADGRRLMLGLDMGDGLWANQL